MTEARWQATARTLKQSDRFQCLGSGPADVGRYLATERSSIERIADGKEQPVRPPTNNTLWGSGRSDVWAEGP